MFGYWNFKRGCLNAINNHFSWKRGCSTNWMVQNYYGTPQISRISVPVGTQVGLGNHGKNGKGYHSGYTWGYICVDELGMYTRIMSS